MTFATINPSTEETIREYSNQTFAEVLPLLEASASAFSHWRHTPLIKRAECFINVASLLRNHQEKFSTLITTEMGKPITAANAEITKCAKLCQHYAEYAEDYLQEKHIQTDYRESKVCYQPIGPIFGIMPWNFPFWQVFRFIAPNLMAGNVTLLKHAPNVTGCALEIESLMAQAGFPENVFKTVILDNDTAEKVIAHPSIAAVTLTGSERAGRAVAQAAGQALKKVVLELGGSDPYIILTDADLKLAAKTCVTSRLNNAGQVCIAAKRIIIPEAIYDEAKALILSNCQEYQIGDPLNPNTNLGPLARADLRDTVAAQVHAAQTMGAQILCGGGYPDRKGYYYEPTCIENITPDSPAYQDEIFGPVIALLKVANEEEAIQMANDNRFGLGAAIFSEDIERAKDIATTRIHSGSVAINTLVSSDPSLPFGGTKQSGFGRELGQEGLLEFCNVKTITVG